MLINSISHSITSFSNFAFWYKPHNKWLMISFLLKSSFDWPVWQPYCDGGNEGRALLQVRVRPGRPRQLDPAFSEVSGRKHDHLRAQRPQKLPGRSRTFVGSPRHGGNADHRRNEVGGFWTLLLCRTNKQWNDSRLFALEGKYTFFFIR